MPKRSAKIEVNTFVQGIITEASPLNFPPNASLDEQNYELNRDGTRFRRRGMDFEPNYVIQAFPYSLVQVPSILAVAPAVFKWGQVAGDLELHLIVVQFGKFIFFYDSEVVPLSAGQIGSLTLSEFPEGVQYSFTSIDGRLIVAAGLDTIAIITYSEGAFTYVLDRIKTRDIWGVQSVTDTGYEDSVSYRSSTADQNHIYNLQNQSWAIPRKSQAGMLSDPINLYLTGDGRYPSNSEVVWPGLQFQPVSQGQDPFERIYVNIYAEVRGASVETAKGYFIIDALRRGTSRAEQAASNQIQYPELVHGSFTLPADYTPGGASVLCGFAGRVFYAGFDGTVIEGDKRSPNLSNIIFFSQLVKSRPDIVNCYQAGDPTSRENSDVVDTDGGFIRISSIEGILGMVNLGTHLIVIAKNGVWTVSGGSDYGFTATNFKVDKIANFRGISKTSIIEDAGRAFFWGEDGIYVVAKDQYGVFGVTSITEKTIQTYYEDIPNTSKAGAIGVYDSIGKKIRWLYKEGTAFTSDSVTRELVLDLTLNSFYPNLIYNNDNNKTEVFNLFAGSEFKISNEDIDVVVDSDPVLSATDQVVIPDEARQPGVQSTRYLYVSITDGVPKYGFSYYWNTEFKDWKSVDNLGTDAFAFILTGAQTGGDSSVVKQIPYLTMHFYRTETGVDANFIPLNQSGCLVRTQWDWANSANSNKFGPLWQTYRYKRPYLATGPSDPYDTGFELVTSKTKLRGRGKAFALYMQTEPEKDCRIVGWSLSVNANTIT